MCHFEEALGKLDESFEELKADDGMGSVVLEATPGRSAGGKLMRDKIGDSGFDMDKGLDKFGMCGGCLRNFLLTGLWILEG